LCEFQVAAGERETMSTAAILAAMPSSRTDHPGIEIQDGRRVAGGLVRERDAVATRRSSSDRPSFRRSRSSLSVCGRGRIRMRLSTLSRSSTLQSARLRRLRIN